MIFIHFSIYHFFYFLLSYPIFPLIIYFPLSLVHFFFYLSFFLFLLLSIILLTFFSFYYFPFFPFPYLSFLFLVSPLHYFISFFLSAAESMGFRCVGANLGRTAEFTVKSSLPSPASKPALLNLIYFLNFFYS